MPETKSDLRLHIRQLKKQHDAGQLAAWSQAVGAVVANTKEWQDARTVLLYHPLPDELDILYNLPLEGKTVLLPVVQGDDIILRQMNGCDVHQEKPGLTKGAFGIMEPTGPLFTDFAAIDLAIIPGVAFTREGARLGRGKGYYDRFLTQLQSHTILWGVCFTFQILDRIPLEQHDRMLHRVITCGD